MVLFSKKDLCPVTSKSPTDLSGVFSSIFYSSCEIVLCFFIDITLPQRERGDHGLSLLNFLSHGACLSLHLCTCHLFAYLPTFSKLKWSFPYCLLCYPVTFCCQTIYPLGCSLQTSERVFQGTSHQFAWDWRVHC